MTLSDETPGLTPEEITRYSRHLALPDVGMVGQRRLKAASVLLVGAGGLGAPAGLYLAAAGIGRLGIADADAVELSNLQRQVMYSTNEIGRPKAESAARRLREINPDIEIVAHATRATSANAFDLLRPYDIVIDGTDNFPTRYLLNDACVLLGKPNIYGAIFRFHGQVSVFSPPQGPCYRCLYPEPPPPETVPNCAEGGVLGVLPGVIGSLQATEAIKIILGKGRTLAGRLVLYDALDMEFRELAIARDPNCPVCGDHPTIAQLIDYESFCGAQAADSVMEISVEEAKARLDRNERFDLLDVRTTGEWEICRIDGARLLPLGELPGRLRELDPEREIVVCCKTGARSAAAAAILRGAGFRKVAVLRGGVSEWGRSIDPSMPRY